MTNDIAMVALAGTVARATVQLMVVAVFALLTMRAARQERADVAPWLVACTVLAGIKLAETVLLWPAVAMSASWLGISAVPMVNAAAQGLALLSSVGLWGAITMAMWRLVHAPVAPDERV